MKRIYLLLLGLLGIHLLILSKLQFTAWPEMLSFPYMVDRGFLIYKDFHHVYQPLLTYILLIYYKFFGFSPESLKIFTWISILIIDLLIFIISKQILKKSTWLSLIPVGLYVLLQPLFEGNMMWFDIAMIVPLLLSIYFIFLWSSNKKNIYIFLSGFSLTLAFLIKQQAILAFLPFFIFLLMNKVTFKQFITFAFGASFPVVVTILPLMLRGDFKDYIFWTFQFPLYWLPKFPGYKILPAKREWLVILLMVVIPLFAIIFDLLKKKVDSKKILIYGIFLTLLLSAFPRFSFFHLQPFLALFILATAFLISQKNKILYLIAVLVIIYIGTYRYRLILPDLAGGIRFYGKNEIQLIQYINSITIPDDKIYLLGPQSAIYVYAGRIPPKPWIENYVWHFEIPGLQEKVISGWKIDPPKIIFWIPPTSGNWFDLGTYQPKKIVEYIESNYTKIDQVNGIDVWKIK